MKLIHTKNYEAMSKEAADLLLDTLRKKPDAVISVSYTHLDVYKRQLLYVQYAGNRGCQLSLRCSDTESLCFPSGLQCAAGYALSLIHI